MTWTGVTDTEYRETARKSVRLPLADHASEISLTLSYDFREAAKSALVASQRCTARGL